MSLKTLEPRDIYEQLRAHWRACRCAQHAALVEAAGRRFATGAALGSEGLRAWHAEWIARAQAGSPLDLAHLLDSLEARATPRNTSRVALCLEELARHADDPQLTLPLVRLLELPAGSSAWNKVHTRLFKLLEATGDPRALDALQAAVSRSQVFVPNQSDAMRASLGRAEKTWQRLAARFPDGVPDAPPHVPRNLDAALETAPAPRPAPDARSGDERLLLQAIWEHPEDDARRQVYADCLQERGDPRGEFIALQLGNPQAQQRAARLLDGKVRAWCGAIGKAVIVSTAKFERGFLAVCETDVKRKSEAEVVFAHPEWATVRQLVFKGHAGLSRWMQSLEDAQGVTQSALASLATIQLPRLRRLILAEIGAGDGLLDGRPRSQGLKALIATTGLPQLRELDLGLISHEFQPRELHGRARTVDDFAWLLQSPLGRQLEALTVPFHLQKLEVLPAWLDALRAGKTPGRLSLHSRDFEIHFDRARDPLTATVRLNRFRSVQKAGFLRSDMDTLRAALERLVPVKVDA